MGLTILSSVEKLSSSLRLKINYCYVKGVQSSWEIVLFSEGLFIGNFHHKLIPSNINSKNCRFDVV